MSQLRPGGAGARRAAGGCAAAAPGWPARPSPPPPRAGPMVDAGAATAAWPRIEGDLAAIERLNDGYRRITRELGKVIVGQQQRPRGAADRHLRPRPLPAGRRARPGQDADDPHAGRRAEPELQPHPVHARPDAVRHHRHRGAAGGQDDRPARLQVPARADLRQRHPGRRDQPHAAQDAGRPARSDAGAPGHRRRHAAPAARPVLRAGHAEPDRAGRHLSAARGAAGPLHVQHPGRLPRGGGGVPHRRDDDGDARSRRSSGCCRRPTSWRCRTSSARCRWRRT